MAAIDIPTVTNWSVTPQNGQANYFTLMNTWLSESTSVIQSFNDAIAYMNSVATLTVGAIDDVNIGTDKTFSNTYILENYMLKNINSFTDKTTPIDTDNLALQESGGLLKKLSWLNLKATLKTYFDTLYPAISGYPAFSASKASQSFTANVQTKLACDVESYDTTNEYDNVTNFRFTPQKAGKYRVTAKMQSLLINAGANISIYKNGSLFSRLQGTTANSFTDTISGSITVDMNGTTDYIEAYGYWSSNNTASSIFQAEYIVGV